MTVDKSRRRILGFAWLALGAAALATGPARAATTESIIPPGAGEHAMVFAPAAPMRTSSRIIHHLAYSRSGRRAYGMYEPRDVRDPAPIWSSRDAAVDGNNANSISGSNSAVENEGSSG